MTSPLSTRRPPPLLTGVGLAGGAIGLLVLGGLLLDRWPLAFDRAMMLWIRGLGGAPALRHAARDVTALGGGTVLTLVVLLAAGLLTALRHHFTALMLVAAAWSGSLAVSWLKSFVGRPRPALVEHWAYVDNASFPSGHAASSAVIYLTLAALASQVVRERAARTYMLGGAIMLAGLIGVSRVYLGVHWPSDVLAGWSFGTLWALGWWRATAWARASLRQS